MRKFPFNLEPPSPSATSIYHVIHKEILIITINKQPDYELSFMRLLEKCTNGAHFDVSYTGTAVHYRPGVIVGGRVEHDCSNPNADTSNNNNGDGSNDKKANGRPIAYYLEPLLALAPFAKNPLHVMLYGVTNDARYVSVDLVRTVLLPQLRRFGVEGAELKVVKRGAPPLGGGQIIFTCPTVRQLTPVQYTDPGRIKRIRGLAYAARVSPQCVNRVVEAARGPLNRFIPDVFIYSDVYRGDESGRSPGFAVSLVAESTTGVLLSAERVAQGGEAPEDVGAEAARLLCHEISLGGSVDTCSQWLNLLMMTLCPEDVCKVRTGKLSPFS